MTTEIGQLRLQLPAGLEARAQRIAGLVGAALAERGDLPAGRIEQIGVGPLTVDPRASDRAIAATIATSIAAAIGRHPGG
jgi:hypothetical protein